MNTKSNRVELEIMQSHLLGVISRAGSTNTYDGKLAARQLIKVKKLINGREKEI